MKTDTTLTYYNEDESHLRDTLHDLLSRGFYLS